MYTVYKDRLLYFQTINHGPIFLFALPKLNKKGKSHVYLFNLSVV